MPYSEHPHFFTPEDEQEIWRYMSISKFLSLLTKSSLYFTKCSILKKIDPFEGTIPIYTLNLQSATDDEILRRVRFSNAHGELVPAESIDPDLVRSTMTMTIPVLQAISDCTAVSCWYLANHESAAMWNLYAAGGVAISSTIGRLKLALRNHPDSVWIAKVKYLDYRTEDINIHNVLNLVLSKRKSYSHENEVRAFVSRGINESYDGSGVYVDVDLRALIASVHVAPSCEDWFYDAVKDTLEILRGDVSIRRSQLDDPAVW